MQSRKKSVVGYHIALGFLIFGLLVQGITAAYFYTAEKINSTNELYQRKIALAEISKAKEQLQALVKKTVKLAENGNSNATYVVKQFKAGGVDLRNLEQVKTK